VARRLIGLDVGTNAVALAEVSPGDPPTLRAFGQVALPRDAMREGEVVDEGAVAEAIARLRGEIGLKRGAVRVGIASPRLIVRQVEMPQMSEGDLRSALQFQAQDLIPIPIDEAVLDFAILGRGESDDGEPTMRVLLAAAQEATVERLARAVEAGGLSVAAVDLIPLALVRALGRPVADNGPGAEGIVSFGGGVTVVVVHEMGMPAFVRVLGTGGRELTDAIAAELELPEETAESLKRQLGAPGASEDAVAQARGAIDRPLGVLLDEVRSSLDYYRNQPGATRLLRVVVTGGTSQLPGLADRLTTLVGVPVELARPRDLLAIGDIGFDEADLPRLDPYLPAPVGLALGGTRGGAVIDLSVKAARRGAAPGRGRAAAAAVAGAAVLIGLLAVPTLSRQGEIDDEKEARAAAEQTNADLQAEIAQLSEAQQKQQRLEAAQAQLGTVLLTDVSWSRMLQEVARTIPNDVWLTAFAGNLTPADPSLGAATAINGTVNFSANGLDFPSVASWLQRMSEIPSFTGLWVASAASGDFGGREIVTFSSSSRLTDEARSDRAEELGVEVGGPTGGTTEPGSPVTDPTEPPAGATGETTP
jgi:type IV pilus assembly protein PilM